jgi:hypothetical protein
VPDVDGACPFEAAIARTEAAMVMSFALPGIGLSARYKCKRCGGVAGVVDRIGYCSWCDPGTSVVIYDEHGAVTRYAPVTVGYGRQSCGCGRTFWTLRRYQAHWAAVREGAF